MLHDDVRLRLLAVVHWLFPLVCGIGIRFDESVECIYRAMRLCMCMAMRTEAQCGRGRKAVVVAGADRDRQSFALTIRKR